MEKRDSYSVEYMGVKKSGEHVAVIRDGKGKIVETISAPNDSLLKRTVEEAMKKYNKSSS